MAALTERFYFYGLGGAEHDAGRQLDLRLRANVGLGREFIQNERRKLAGGRRGLSPQYWLEYDLIQERLAEDASRDTRARLTQYGRDRRPDRLHLIEASLRYLRDVKSLEFDNDTHTEDSINVHASSHYEQQVFTRSLFTSDLTYEPDVDDLSSFRLLSDLGFLTPLSEKMSLKMRLNSEYDSDTGEWMPSGTQIHDRPGVQVLGRFGVRPAPVPVIRTGTRSRAAAALEHVPFCSQCETGGPADSGYPAARFENIRN